MPDTTGLVVVGLVDGKGEDMLYRMLREGGFRTGTEVWRKGRDMKKGGREQLFFRKD